MRSACKVLLLAWYFVFIRGEVPTQVGPFDTKDECKKAEQKVVDNSSTIYRTRILIECWERKDRERRGRAMAMPVWPF